MTQAAIRAAWVGAVSGLALAGCVAGTDPMGGVTDVSVSEAGGAPVARAATSGSLADRDVESPEVFQASDQALWDGRPSLGGVWVASPEATDPERVVIRNPQNGNFVIGALFRRERLNPGPTLQISSDAAAALGILAGAPTVVEVVALRRSEAPAPVEPAAEPEVAAAAVPDAADGDAADGDAGTDAAAIGATAAAAIARAEGAEPEPAAVASAGAITATPLDGPAAEAAADNAATVPVPDVVAAPKKKRKWPWSKKTEADPLTALAADPASPEEIQPVAAVATAVETTPVAAPQGGRLIQIGIFSVEDNAGRAVSRLEGAGVPARILTETAKGKTFWRVVAGPGADDAMLGKVKTAGFADAYFVRS